eukprot:c39844_g1_i1.p1 GENE.c39844_g1_i1~~c39844_g1_i1.p1  ORF type:complete len:562 (+),score=134.79 c39844_g1_i1:44-1687(+)
MMKLVGRGARLVRVLRVNNPRFYHSAFTFDPQAQTQRPVKLHNLVNGEWTETAAYEDVIDPMNSKNVIARVPDTSVAELTPFLESLARCPKTGVHNPFKNVDRYVMLGEVSHRAGAMLDAELEYFIGCIQRVMPKSYIEAKKEAIVTAQFLKNFGGDNVRFLARSFGVPGDRDGQVSTGHRFPFGPVALISPFNFPLEIPVLQLMGALFMGNKPVVKSDSRVSLVLEQFVRLLHVCGLPKEDIDVIHSSGSVMQNLLERSNVRLTQFTGSQSVAERLASLTHGKVRLEDAGFDWKIIGPDGANDPATMEYVAWQSDQDAYACSGQKCSAQSICFAHENWVKAGLIDRLMRNASRRSLSDLTVGPVLSVTTETMLQHIGALLKIPGARLLFGGKPLTGHSIPAKYGTLEPTAVFVPLHEMLKTSEVFNLVTKEIFGPFQIVTEYNDKTLRLVLAACENMQNHLTAAIVSNDISFQNKVLAHTVNGTTYVGIRARTTGAPQNHWFGPAGDPRGAGIGTREAIQMVWSCHREVIHDCAPVDGSWKQPLPS